MLPVPFCCAAKGGPNSFKVSWWTADAGCWKMFYKTSENIPHVMLSLLFALLFRISAPRREEATTGEARLCADDNDDDYYFAVICDECHLAPPRPSHAM